MYTETWQLLIMATWYVAIFCACGTLFVRGVMQGVLSLCIPVYWIMSQKWKTFSNPKTIICVNSWNLLVRSVMFFICIFWCMKGLIRNNFIGSVGWKQYIFLSQYFFICHLELNPKPLHNLCQTLTGQPQKKDKLWWVLLLPVMLKKTVFYNMRHYL